MGPSKASVNFLQALSMEVPTDLVQKVRELIANRETA